MVFSSLVFLIRFLPIFFICYYVAPGRMKNFILFLGSLIFYAWGEPVYVLLMLGATFYNYLQGFWLGLFRRKIVRLSILVAALVVNVVLLGVFKYTDYLPLPIGMSFYTFQMISYLIDVYRGQIKAERNVLDFCVYVTMFPQLAAGPVVRYQQVAEQLHNRPVDLQQVYEGMMQFIVGLGKKALLANNLGQMWQEISGGLGGEMTVLTSWLGIICYGLYIYLDFSAYSDMAIGLGRMLGFTLPENFHYPYIACSVSQFWHRWHISLSSWFRDYIYFPLGGNRKGLQRQLLNVLIVWLLVGLWHGFHANTLVWALWSALFLIFEKLFLGKLMKHLPYLFGRVYTWVVILIGWVWFSADSLGEAVTYLSGMFGLNGAGLWDNWGIYTLLQCSVLLVVSVIAATPFAANLIKRLKNTETGSAIALYRLGAALIIPVLLLLSIAYVVDAPCNSFLYFRF